MMPINPSILGVFGIVILLVLMITIGRVEVINSKGATNHVGVML
jgi:hypothetical protein